LDNNFKKDLDKAVKDFNVVKPLIEKWLDCKLTNIEDSKNDKLKSLDLHNGIDVILEKDNKIFGCAFRICYQDYNTFTIRKSRSTGSQTEFKKRKEQISDNELYPKFTFQVYITPDYIKIAVVNTKDLYNMIDENTPFRYNNSDNNGFYYINFEKLNIKPKIYNSVI